MSHTPPKIMGVIPARLNSTRLPGKALREIAGKPMIHWVYQNAKRSPLLSELVVATDSPEIQASCEAAGIPVTLTGEHPSGGDRLHEVMTPHRRRHLRQHPGRRAHPAARPSGTAA